MSRIIESLLTQHKKLTDKLAKYDEKTKPLHAERERIEKALVALGHEIGGNALKAASTLPAGTEQKDEPKTDPQAEKKNLPFIHAEN
jgi:hypothetical protein